MVARRLIAAVRAPTTRWLTLLVVVLAATLTVSVRAAMRAPDVTVAHQDARTVRYATLGGLPEVGFEADDASTQGSGRVIALPEPQPGPGGSSPRPTRAPPTDDPVIEPDPDDDDDDGEEIRDPLGVTANSDRTHAGQGDPITYTFSVTNTSDVVQENVIAETHIPAGTYAAGSCAGLADEGTLQPPTCADVPGLPASGSDDYHVLRSLGTMQPGARAQWQLKVRVGADTADGVAVVNHCRARTTTAVVVASSDVWVTVT